MLISLLTRSGVRKIRREGEELIKKEKESMMRMRTFLAVEIQGNMFGRSSFNILDPFLDISDAIILLKRRFNY